jgi:hypothetical protein
MLLDQIKIENIQIDIDNFFYNFFRWIFFLVSIEIYKNRKLPSKSGFWKLSRNLKVSVCPQWDGF